MDLSFRWTATILRVTIGLTGIGFAAKQWLWFRTLPRFAAARFCGNCFLGTVGMPTELGLLGLVLLAGVLVKAPHRPLHAMYWCSAILGIALAS
jgi:hypothetical protein